MLTNTCPNYHNPLLPQYRNKNNLFFAWQNSRLHLSPFWADHIYYIYFFYAINIALFTLFFCRYDVDVDENYTFFYVRKCSLPRMKIYDHRRGWMLLIHKWFRTYLYLKEYIYNFFSMGDRSSSASLKEKWIDQPDVISNIFQAFTFRLLSSWYYKIHGTAPTIAMIHV